MIALVADHAIASTAAEVAEQPTRRIVVLNSADAYLPAFVAVDDALRRAVVDRMASAPEFYLESLDMFRFPRALLVGDISELLRTKYRGLKVDIVVAAGTPAFEFAVRNGEEIWPGAAIVFHSVPGDYPRLPGPGSPVVGIPTQLDLTPTIDLALKLRPTTRRVAVVAGAAELDRQHLSHARAALERRAGHLDVRYIAGLERLATVEAVRALPSDAVVLYLTAFRDGAGRPLVPREMLAEVAAASKVPVFGMYDTYVGSGVVAGGIASYEAQGRRAGELVARVLKGEDPVAIGVQAPVAAGCVADWRQLRRWGIDPGLLPDDCEVRFKEVTLWDRYHWQILAGLTVITAQAALIAALLIQLRKRRRAESVAQRQRDELAHATRLTAMGELTASIAHEVNQPLGAILANVDAAEMLLESDNMRTDDLRRILADVRRDDLRASEVIRRLRALLAKHQVAHERIDVNAAIEEVLALLAAEARRRGVDLATELDAQLPGVTGDRIQLQQVILNLIVNAMEAMGSATGARRRVLVRTRRADEGAVEVSVIDNGPGIAPGMLDRLFDSFFTTKAKGMGLGLSIARTIVEAHGGRIWAESDGHGGAVLRFTLPGPGTEDGVTAKARRT